jgi:beta-glucuronidase
VFEVDPGRIVPMRPHRLKPVRRIPLSTYPIQAQLGKGPIHLTQFTNGHWQMFVGNKPFVIRGVSYNVVPVGRSPDNGTLVVHRDWMLEDENKNGKIDGPYDSWVDVNRNNRQDPKERVVGDFRLLHDMGANTIRLYHHEYNKPLLRDLYSRYHIRVMIGDLLGAYTVGSGADWSEGTDYNDKDQRRDMLESVREMVESEKDEPYLLLWVLGNENNFGNGNNCRKFPEAYYSLVNEAAILIKSLDGNHPVALANGDLTFIETAAALCPDVDIFGVNAYHGRHGMGDSFWRDIRDLWKKPVLITEFGAPAYDQYRPEAEGEKEQAEFLRNNWDDIEWNLAAGPGQGNALGGVIYEWMDEWWKSGPAFDPGVHDKSGQFQGPFPDGWSYEEWYGIVSQGDGSHSPFLRQLRPAYYVFKNDLWNPKKWIKRGLPN